MPVPPPTITPAFDTVDVAMNMARVQLNDCPLALSGNLLSDAQPYTQTFYNLGWREFQKDLAMYGDPAQTSEFISPSLPPVSNIDPYTSVYLSQTAYFDGTSFWVPPDVNVLPQDLIIPLWIRERLGGSQQLFSDMTPCDNGLPGYPKTTYEKYWEWRSAGPGNGNAVFMPGSTIPRDIYVRYASFLPDAVTATDNSVQWYQQPIPILRCADTLAFYVAAKFAFSRGSEQATAVGNSFLQQGKDAMRSYLNATTMKLRQRVNHRRRPYAAGRHNGWQWW